jgi:hypothetical protein
MDIVGEIASKLGVPQEQARNIAGTVLGTIRKEAPADVAQEMDAKVPEAREWEPPAQSGGGLGGLGGMLGGALGGGGGAAAGLLGQLSRFGVDASSIGKLVPTVVQFLQSRIGADKVEKLMSHVPFLKQFGGGGDGGGGGGGLGGLGGLFGR